MREAERKRLEELILEFERTCPETCTGLEKSCAQCVLEQKIDHLLDNGVVVPPCKVGDKVYVTDMYENIAKVTECTVLGYDAVDENGIGIMEYKPCEYVPYISSVACFLDEIGKTVFLTREEAEAKLKGGEE